MKKVLWWFSVVVVGMAVMSTSAMGQDAEDRDSWAGGTGDWGNDDNWRDNNGDLSIVPTFDDDRWALVGSGTAQVGGDFKVAGLTIGAGGTVEIAAGASLEIDREDNFFSVGQSDLQGTLRILGDGSYKGLDGQLGRRGNIEMSQPGKFELSGDADLNGSYHFTITDKSSPILKVGGAAKVGGTLFPSFVGASPEFGDKIPFVEGNSVELNNASVELPASVSLPRGLDARIVKDGNTAALEFGNLPILQVHRATGESKITNVVGGPLDIVGYSVESARGTLNPDNFTGFGGDSWDRPNPVATSVAELNLTDQKSLAVDEVLQIGNVYNGGATHPNDEDVAFNFVTPDGDIRAGLVEYLGPANDLVLNLNPQTGEATIQHLSSFIDPVEVTGYSISSASGSLLVDNLAGFADTGAAGEGWTEANPNSSLISELNPLGSKVFDNGTVISLGNIFNTEGPRDITLQYTTVDALLDATVEYQIPGDLPEPFLEADFNKDGIVNFTDFLVLSTQFNQTVDPAGTAPDINSNGVVDFPDFLVLSTQFNMSRGGAAAVPEPTGVSLLGIGGMLLLASRRRRRVANPVSKRFSLLLFLPALAVFCGQANAQVCELDDCPIDELRVFTGEVVNITGPADIVSLRQPNNILYAVNVWGDELERVVNGVSFWSDKEDVNPDGLGLDGYRTDWTHTVTNWQNKPEFGDTDSDNELEEIMTDIRWTDNSPAAHPDPGVGSHFAVSTGDRLYLELLISGGHNENRIWDIYIDGEPVVSEFDSTNYREYDVGEVYAYRGEFVAKDNEFNVTFNQERRGGIDGNAILQAAILSKAGDPLVLGDFNSDGAIDLGDYGIMLANFHKQGAAFEEGDIDFNRIVDIRDFAKFRPIFGAQPAGAAAAVPEPASLLSFGLATLLLGVFRRRRSN